MALLGRANKSRLFSCDPGFLGLHFKAKDAAQIVKPVRDNLDQARGKGKSFLMQRFSFFPEATIRAEALADAAGPVEGPAGYKGSCR